MRKLFLACALLGALATSLHAQDTDNRLNDQQRVALTPVVLDDAIPAGAHKQLVNK
jgi:hypothetical protein